MGIARDLGESKGLVKVWQCLLGGDVAIGIQPVGYFAVRDGVKTRTENVAGLAVEETTQASEAAP